MQRRSVDLPEPGRADQRDRLVLGDLQVDALQDLELAERLGDAADLDDGRAHPRALSGESHQSSRRAIGIVMHR